MTSLSNTLEGTSGTALASTGNGSPNAVASTKSGTGTTVTFDNTHAHTGSTACEFSLPTVAATAYVEWSGQTSTANAYFRGYFYLTANPSVAAPAFVRMLATSTLRGGCSITSTGILRIFNSSSTTLASSSSSIPLNQWVRLEFEITGISGTTGNVTLRLYSGSNLEGTTPDFTLSSTGATVGGNVDDIRIGQSNSVTQTSAWSFWVDDIAYSDVASPGPLATNITVTGPAMAVTSASTAGAVQLSCSVTGPAAAITSAAPAGSVNVGGSVTVIGAAMAVTAAAPAGSKPVTLTGAAAAIAAATPAGSLRQTLGAPAFAVTAAAPAGAVNPAPGSDVTLTGPPIAAQAALPAGYAGQMGTISYRTGATPGFTGAGTSVSLTIPATVQAGDAMILNAGWDGGAGQTLATPTGWTKLTQQFSANHFRAVFWRVATAADAGSSVAVTLSAASKLTATLDAYTGTDKAAPVFAFGVTVNAGNNAPTTLPSVSLTFPNGWVFAAASDKAAPPSSAFTWSALTQRSNGCQTTSSAVSIATADSNSAVPSGSYAPGTTTGTTSSGSWIGIALALIPATVTTSNSTTVTGPAMAVTAAAPAGSIATGSAVDLTGPVAALALAASAGAVSTASATLVNGTCEVGQTTLELAAKVTGGVTLTMRVSPNPDMSSAVFISGSLTADISGYIHPKATGLPAGTKLYWQLYTNGVGFGGIHSAKTLPTGASSFKVAFGGCATTSNTDGAAFTDLTAWAPDFWVHLGDFHYTGNTATTVASHLADFENQTANEGSGALKAALLATPVFYTPSDHEAGPDNGGSNDTGEPYWPYQRRAMEVFWPTGSLVDARSPRKGMYRSFVVGRVKFIQIDNRNGDRTDVTSVGTTGDTLLGSTQKAWLKSELLTAEPFKVILGDTQWLGTETNGTTPIKADWWPAYPLERQEIADYITTNRAAIGHVEYWHSDAHAVGYINAASNPTGAFDVLCAAPFANTGGGRNLSTFTASYNNGGGTCHLYGRVTFTDNGSTITRLFQGWDATGAGTAQVSQTVSVATAGVTGPPLAIAAALPAGTVTVTSSKTLTGPAAPTLTALPAGTVGTGCTVTGPAIAIAAATPAGTLSTVTSTTLTGDPFAITATAPAGVAVAGTAGGVALIGGPARLTSALTAGTFGTGRTLTGPVVTVTAAVPPGSLVISISVTLAPTPLGVQVSQLPGVVTVGRSVRLAAAAPIGLKVAVKASAQRTSGRVDNVTLTGPSLGVGLRQSKGKVSTGGPPRRVDQDELVDPRRPAPFEVGG